MVSQTFPALNNHTFNGLYEEEYAAFVKVANSQWPEDQLAEWFAANSVETSA